MNYQTSLLKTAIAAIATVTISAPVSAAFVAFGDDASIYFTGEAQSRYTTNLFNNYGDKEEELYFVFSPGLEFNMGQGDDSMANIILNARQDFYVYSDTSRLDKDLTVLNAFAEYGEERWETDMNASFEEVAQNNAQAFAASDFVQYDRYVFNGGGRYDFTPKTRGTLRFIYNQTQYQNFTNIYNDRESFAIPVKAYYAYSPTLYIGLGYRWRKTNVELDGAGTGSNQYTDHYFNFSATGDFSPKLTGEFDIGFQTREAKVGEDSDGISLGSSLTYAYSPKLNFNGGLERDFNQGGNGNTLERSGAYVGATYQYSARINAGANVSYYIDDYKNNSDREDHIRQVGLSTSYIPNEYLTLSAGYNYIDVGTNAVNTSYMSHTFSLSATLRY